MWESSKDTKQEEANGAMMRSIVTKATPKPKDPIQIFKVVATHTKAHARNGAVNRFRQAQRLKAISTALFAFFTVVDMIAVATTGMFVRHGGGGDLPTTATP